MENFKMSAVFPNKTYTQKTAKGFDIMNRKGKKVSKKGYTPSRPRM
jgi:hypothetical protein